jgi:chromosomal replication initiation ATPase DnaA
MSASTQITVSLVVAAVSDATGIHPSHINGSNRRREFSYARFTATSLIKKRHPRWTVTRIAIAMGIDHSTVTHRLRRASQLLESEPEFRADYEKAESILNEEVPCQI